MGLYTVRTLTKNFPEGPEMAISGKVFRLRVKVLLIRVLSHLGPWARIRKVFLFKGFGAQKSFFVKGLRVLRPLRVSALAFWGFQGRPRAPKWEKFFCLRVKVSLIRVSGFGQNRKSFLFKGFRALRKVFLLGFLLYKTAKKDGEIKDSEKDCEIKEGEK